jgi:glucosamine-6-phosphate deaminase
MEKTEISILYLDGLAMHSRTVRKEAVSRRLLRNMIEIYEEDNVNYLENRIDELINYFKTQYPGKKDIAYVQKLKGMMREFEEELVWAFFGFNTDSVSHMRLGFYQGDIFTENPEMERDVLPILELLKEIKPTVVNCCARSGRKRTGYSLQSIKGNSRSTQAI